MYVIGVAGHAACVLLWHASLPDISSSLFSSSSRGFSVNYGRSKIADLLYGGAPIPLWPSLG